MWVADDHSRPEGKGITNPLEETGLWAGIENPLEETGLSNSLEETGL